MFPFLALAKNEPAWAVPLFLGLFPVGWCLILALLARVGGWSDLASRHRADSRPTAGETVYFLGGSSSSVSYRNTLILTAAPEGVYLRNMFLFRPFHPPLRLPWAGVQALERRKQWLGPSLVLVYEEGKTRLEVYLPARAWQHIRAAAGERFTAIDRPPPLG